MENIGTEKLDYYKVNRLSRSSLCDLKVSPYYFWAKNIAKTFEQSTKPMDIGRAMHTYILENDKFNSLYAVAPDVDKRTKIGKEAFREFEENSRGKEILEHKDFALIEKIYQSLKSYDKACMLLDACDIKEGEFYYEYRGLKLKSKLDLYSTKKPIVIDIKSVAGSRTDKKMVSDLISYDYAEQVFLYSYAYEQEYKVKPSFFMVSLSKSEPYEIGIYNISDFYEYGKFNIDNLIDEYNKCFDRWGASPEVPWRDGEIKILDLPAWASAQMRYDI